MGYISPLSKSLEKKGQIGKVAKISLNPVIKCNGVFFRIDEWFRGVGGVGGGLGGLVVWEGWLVRLSSD